MTDHATVDHPDALEILRDALRAFAAERDWDQFHSPKNLAMALSVEAGELLEHFQWITESGSTNLPPEKLAKVSEEIADGLALRVGQVLLALALA